MVAEQNIGTMVDTHVHVWSDDRTTYPMVAGRERPLAERGSADWLLELMDEAGVAAAVLVQTPWYGEDNRYLVESMRRFPGRLAAVGYLEDPLAPDAAARLERQFAEDGFRGVRLHLTEARVNDGVLGGAADPLLRRASSLGVPVCFLNRLPQHPTIQAVAGRFPDLTIVVDHLGHPDVAEAPSFASSATLLALAAYPNVYVKVSNHVMHSREPYPWRDLHDFQRRLLDRYGPRRLMWGSNWPMRMPNPSYLERLDAVRTHLPFLTPDDHAWILGRTALSLWTPVA